MRKKRCGWPMRILLAACVLPLLGVQPASGQDEVNLSVQARVSPRIPIAFKPFVPRDGTAFAAAVQDTVNQVLMRDLSFSGVFAVRDLSIPARVGTDEDAPVLTGSAGDTTYVFMDAAGEVDLELLRKLSVQVMVSGTYEVTGSRVEMSLRLTDLGTRRTIMEKGYAAFDLTLRRIVHLMADDIVFQLTGDRGTAQTRVVFVSQRSGAPELYISDYDGFNLRQLTRDGARKYSPNWSPDGTRIAYTSYRDGPHELYILDLRSGETRKIPFGGRTVLSPRWSPAGRHLILSLVTEGVSRLYISTLNGSRLVPLATGYGINVSPSWSPRGDQVVYMSDRLTQKHLYVINIDGSNDHRITFEGGYNGSPAWSPRGDRIAFVGGDLATGRRGGPRRVFNIYTCDVNGSNLVKLTGVRGPEGDNVNPTWSPDGLHILFSSDRARSGEYHIYRMSWNGGDVHPVITEGNNRQPGWGPRPE
ncbi:MAG: hypothetical protein OXH56_11775 [Gemmatimonadetes bacterium]|nr:hypothetical protein [Gemmatimonadota bacterium]